MPVIGRFYGLILKMYFRQSEHNPPHIHAFRGNELGIFLIHNGEMIGGELSKRDQQRVYAFIMHYRQRLLEMWEKQDYEVLPPIE